MRYEGRDAATVARAIHLATGLDAEAFLRGDSLDVGAIVAEVAKAEACSATFDLAEPMEQDAGREPGKEQGA